MTERTGVYPGTFDPVTSGHVEIVRRSLKLVDRLVIGPATNISNGPLFTLEERVAIIQEDIVDFPEAERSRITVVPFDGLLIHFAKKVNATVIIRGLRAVSDFEYEFQMAAMNRRLAAGIEVLFMVPGEAYTFLSSSLVREVAMLGGDVSTFVPPNVERALREKFRPRGTREALPPVPVSRARGA